MKYGPQKGFKKATFHYKMEYIWQSCTYISEANERILQNMTPCKYGYWCQNPTSSLGRPVRKVLKNNKSSLKS